jgi:hypothetical protein
MGGGRKEGGTPILIAAQEETQRRQATVKKKKKPRVLGALKCIVGTFFCSPLWRVQQCESVWVCTDLRESPGRGTVRLAEHFFRACFWARGL